jgi:hypothetical protein
VRRAKMNAATPGMAAGPMDWFNSLPKISRCYAACLVCTAACVSWGMSFPFLLFLDWRSVFGGLQVRERSYLLLVVSIMQHHLDVPSIMPVNAH